MDESAQESNSPIVTLQHVTEETASTPIEKSPQEFYAEITRRENVRVILEELADA